MRWSKPISGLVWLLVLVTALGAVATLGLEPLAIAGGDFEHQAAATGTVALVIVLTLLAILLGTTRGQGRSTPYW